MTLVLRASAPPHAHARSRGAREGEPPSVARSLLAGAARDAGVADQLHHHVVVREHLDQVALPWRGVLLEHALRLLRHLALLARGLDRHQRRQLVRQLPVLVGGEAEGLALHILRRALDLKVRLEVSLRVLVDVVVAAAGDASLHAHVCEHRNLGEEALKVLRLQMNRDEDLEWRCALARRKVALLLFALRYGLGLLHPRSAMLALRARAGSHTLVHLLF
mmetsp:Transcript_15500/g.36851  ORF Transcript_15500/g.36851 Transcript_15500/m.36851 type:complete len:220 (+) Transcript_15500:146-805(+)